MMFWAYLVVLVTTLRVAEGLRWAPEHVGYNLNENQTAEQPRDYWGEWDNHTYHPSPKSWRFPFYMLTMDRYLDGDPTNNEANGTVFEHHWLTNQFRFGGDTMGLQGDLDYIQGIGIKALYLVGSPFLNRPWSGDGFGPLDFTLLDRHHGAIEDWRNLVTEIHRRGMYVILDNTMATMGDLMAFDGYVNASTPFSFGEYDFLWKTETRYHDFQPGNERNVSCQYPRIWGQNGYPLTKDLLDQMDGCKESEFDQYGDIKSTGSYPSYINSLSKFASVQDRLREWRPDVLEKINRMSCMQIAMFDIDGFRMDKALQTTVDAMADFSTYQRECARRHGKENFMVVGEVVGDPNLASVYIGRGRQPDQALERGDVAVTVTGKTDPDDFIRPFGHSALDGQAFNYDIYGAMTRFLGLDGPWGARGVDWVEQWNFILKHNDMVNANTGEYDPRHMFGMTNHDVFRWPALANGTQRQLLGFFITMIELPGIPMILWGEEQEFYVMENLSNDYVFGRTPVGSSSGWQLHGCYDLSQDVYVDIPFNSSGTGCYDDSVSLDHRDPAKPMRNVLKRIFELRQQYPVLNDGYNLTTLSNKTHNIYLRGSKGIPSPMGLWSVYRGRSEHVQDFTGIGQGNQAIWLLYSNENKTTTYEFDCQNWNTSETLISAFPAGTTVKNLFYPYEELKLEASTIKYGLEGSEEFNGCLPRMKMAAWGWKAFVPKDKWLTPSPTISKTFPGHDERLLSKVPYGHAERVPIEIRFSEEMNCLSVISSMEISSTTDGKRQARLDKDSVDCRLLKADVPRFVGEVATAWTFKAELENVHHGVHHITIRNATAENGNLTTNAVDRIMFRIGLAENPMVFTKLANYTTSLLHRSPESDRLYISPRAAGADRIRYSRNWGSSYSEWFEYTGANITLEDQPWSGTKEQAWDGEHVIVNYWSKMTGSSDHVQHADLQRGNLPPRRFPHVFVQGDFNQYGYDGGLRSEMHQAADDGLWKYDLVADYPSRLIFNVWGMNPDGFPDKSQALGDVDGDNVLDWVPPDSLASNLVNITKPPPSGYLGYRLFVNDGTYRYHFSPVGSAKKQAIVVTLLGIVPILTAIAGVWLFMGVFYQVKFNRSGMREKVSGLKTLWPIKSENEKLRSAISNMFHETEESPSNVAISPQAGAVVVGGPRAKRTIMIATLEYEIEDWNIKIKIGGLGVMSSLMAKHLGHHDLIWVVPCVGDIEYPSGIAAKFMETTVLGEKKVVSVQYHMMENVTFILLDSPVFRKQTKKDPYPTRMDDLESAVFYSMWNQCIAQAIARFEPSIYHINDYHGAAAPLYLLPQVVPCCLSLHNAEFQGLWSLGTENDVNEVCRVFNLDKEVVEKYIQFGGVFNLLHAGASYLRIHQRGYGAVGVSSKYGQRSKQRYPIFWGLPKIGSLPNPDPSDTQMSSISGNDASAVDSAMEANRAMLRCKAQEWAGLNIDPQAELFVFVGRWSMQKGVDIIADVFFSILKENPKTQLLCVGPVIDLYGKFAALKLEKLVKMFPGRVYSKPEFTSLPPFVFSGAEFALIPSRDEPFGLVAVEFGRKGVLGVGSKVGGLGQMPGWWFTIESLTSKHLIAQFKQAIRTALASDQTLRAQMRAKAMVQRFPVHKWVEGLDKLQSNSIRVSNREQSRPTLGQTILRSFTPSASGKSTPMGRSRPQTPVSGRSMSPALEAPAQWPMSGGLHLSLDGSIYSERQLGSRPSSRGHSRAPSQIPSPGFLTPSAESPRDYFFPINRDSSSTQASGTGTALQLGHTDHPQSNSSRPLGDNGLLSPAATPTTPASPGSPALGANRWRVPLLSRMSSSTITSRFKSKTTGTSVAATANPDSSNTDAATEKSKQADLHQVDVIFTDSQNEFYDTFSRKLDKLDGKSSESSLCIEEFLVKSEKAWFGRFHRAKLGMKQLNASTDKPGFLAWTKELVSNIKQKSGDEEHASQRDSTRQPITVTTGDQEFLLGEDYEPPTGTRKFLQKKVGDWQLYCFLLAFGQIIAANSYQLTILTGEYGQAAQKLYIIASIYIGATLVWWYLYRRLQAIYVLSLPFLLYGLAFFILGFGLYAPSMGTRNWVFNVATGLYAAASASGSLYFALNFGTEAGTPAQTWAFRACVIQGTQQIYVAFLWYWGAIIDQAGKKSGPPFSSRLITSITVPVAVLMWVIGAVIFLGLPNYYRRRPGNVPSFYKSLLRRKTVLWFFVMVVLQNYFLSTMYNRSWRFLWSSQHTPAWTIILLLLFFFVFVWSGMLFVLARFSAAHAWLIPIFAISLGAPRWCQTLWATSGIALYIPVLPHSHPMVGALLARSLWLWLGVLDALQGVGFGMILLQTLTRVHVAATLILSQVLGSAVTILARATAPHKLGPGDVFPNFGLMGLDALEKPWFWAGLLSQLVICAGFAKVFRKEQLYKP